MTMCTVCGTVVATEDAGKVDAMPRYLLVRPWSSTDHSSSGDKAADPIVALDAVGAGHGELVMVAQGSSCRQIPQTNGAAVDALIVGIIDIVDEEGRVTYHKSAGGAR